MPCESPRPAGKNSFCVTYLWRLLTAWPDVGEYLQNRSE